MQLPHVVATEPVSPPNVPLRSVGTAMAGWRGVEHANEELARVADSRLEVERYKQAIAAKSEAALIESQMHFEMLTELTALKRTTTDPDTYRTHALERLQQIAGTAETRTENRMTRQFLAQRMPSLIGPLQTEIVHHHDALFLNREHSIGSQIEDLDANSIALIPWQDHARITAEVNKTREKIMGQVNSYGEKATQDRLVNFGYRINEETASREIHDDPDGFLTRANQYALRPETKNKLVERAERRSDHLANQDRLAAERRNLMFKETKHQEIQNKIAELRGKKVEGTLSRSEVEYYGPGGIGILPPADYEHFIDALLHPAPSLSDEKTKLGIEDRLYPSPGPGGEYRYPAPSLKYEIMDARRKGLLSDKDADKYLSHLDSSAQHVSERKEDKGLSQTNHTVSQYLSMGQTLLRTKSLMSPDLDEKGNRAFVEFKNAMINRTAPYGKDDPKAVADELLPRLYRQVRGDKRDMARQHRETIGIRPEDDPVELLNLLDAKQKSAKPLRRPDYESRRTQLQTLIQLEREVTDGDEFLKSLMGGR